MSIHFTAWPRLFCKFDYDAEESNGYIEGHRDAKGIYLVPMKGFPLKLCRASSAS
jgi:hypothetical protein